MWVVLWVAVVVGINVTADAIFKHYDLSQRIERWAYNKTIKLFKRG